MRKHSRSTWRIVLEAGVDYFMPLIILWRYLVARVKDEKSISVERPWIGETTDPNS